MSKNIYGRAESQVLFYTWVREQLCIQIYSEKSAGFRENMRSLILHIFTHLIAILNAYYRLNKFETVLLGNLSLVNKRHHIYRGFLSIHFYVYTAFCSSSHIDIVFSFSGHLSRISLLIPYCSITISVHHLSPDTQKCCVLMSFNL